MLASMAPAAAFAEGTEKDTDSAAAVGSSNTDTVDIGVSGSENDGNDNSYSTYYDKYINEAKPSEEFTVYAKDYSSNDGAELAISEADGKNSVLEWKNLNGSVTWNVNVPTTGIYHIKMSYRTREEGTNTTNDFGFLIDGETPFELAGRLSLNRMWDNEETHVDTRGNDILPQQKEMHQWIEAPLIDTDGLFNEALYFYFEAGTHTITIKAEKANIFIEKFKFYNDKELPSYSDIAPTEADIKATASTSNPIRVEGEKAANKTSSTLQPTSDSSSYLTSPSDPVKKKYNTIGKGNWNQAGQAITWEITAPNDGYYKVNMRVRQNTMKGFYSNRRIYIDGEVLCKELDQYKFKYDTDWYSTTLKNDDGKDMYFYLSKGTHTLTMEVVPGSIGETMRVLDDYVSEINTYYRKILMITGPEPDEYNDYYIDTQIPELSEKFTAIKDGLLAEKAKIEKLTNSKGTEATTLKETAVILERCVKKPTKIPMMLSTIKDNISTLSSWMSDYRNQPLELDYIEVASSDVKFEASKTNFFKSMWFGIQSFVGSFFTDYTNLSDETEGSITVWVAVGRDQAQVVKELVDSYFVPEYNIDVTVNLVTTGLTEAVLSGKGPDVALFSGGDYPIQLGARGKLVDVSKFNDYDEIMSRFADDISTLYTYNDSIYGIPVEQNFPMLFYRTDILAEFGYNQPPETWDEFIDIVRTLQRSYLQAGLVLPGMINQYTNTNYSTTTESGHTFAMLLLQKGQNYYNEALNQTDFTTQEALDAFNMWTDFYTVYDFDQSYDAYSRLRTGEMPMVIQPYPFYNQLYASAPEIRGLWSFCKVPGTKQEDGSISHAANSAGSGALIFANKKDRTDAEYEEYKQQCWTFVKWFTSSEMQTEYGNKIEGIMGILGRYSTANIEALSKLSWSTTEVDLLREQQKQLVEIPVIPASYAVTRNLVNAFRATVNDGENATEAIITYNRDINSEIKRKNQELGIK